MEIFNWEINFENFGKVKVKINASSETYDILVNKIPKNSIDWMREQPKRFGTLKYNSENGRKLIRWDEAEIFLLLKLDILYGSWLYVITHSYVT